MCADIRRVVLKSGNPERPYDLRPAFLLSRSTDPRAPPLWRLRSQLFFDLAPDQLREGVPLRGAQVRRRRMDVQVARVVHELLLQQLQARRGVRLQRLNRRGIGRVQRRTVMVEPLVVK